MMNVEERIKELQIDNLDLQNLNKSINYIQNTYNEHKTAYDNEINKFKKEIIASYKNLIGMCFKYHDKYNDEYISITDVYSDSDNFTINCDNIYCKCIVVNKDKSVSSHTYTLNNIIDKYMPNIIDHSVFTDVIKSTIKFLYVI